MRIEGDGTHVRDMRRWRKRPSVAPRDFQEAVAFVEEVSAIVAAEQAGVRGPDEHAILHGGRCGDRPDLFLARERGSYVGPGSAGVGRARERALAADVLGRAGVDERGIGGILRHAPDGRRIGKHHQWNSPARGIQNYNALGRPDAQAHPGKPLVNGTDGSAKDCDGTAAAACGSRSFAFRRALIKRRAWSPATPPRSRSLPGT